MGIKEAMRNEVEKEIWEVIEQENALMSLSFESEYFDDTYANLSLLNYLIGAHKKENEFISDLFFDIMDLDRYFVELKYKSRTFFTINDSVVLRNKYYENTANNIMIILIKYLRNL